MPCDTSTRAIVVPLGGTTMHVGSSRSTFDVTGGSVRVRPGSSAGRTRRWRSPSVPSVGGMVNDYSDAWSLLPMWMVEAICPPHRPVTDDAVTEVESGQGLRHTETWLSLSDVNGLRSQSA